MWGVFLPIYLYQPLGQSTPKLPYGEPLVWEIHHVVNDIFPSFPRRRRAARPGHPLLRAASRAHPCAAAVVMAMWWLYGRPKDEDEVITKLPPVRNIVVVYSF